MIEHFLIHFSHAHQTLIYLIIFIGMFIEGEAILIFSGILIKGRAINFFDTILIAFVAVIIHDVIYWYIGKLLFTTQKEKILFFNIKKIGKFLKRFKKHNDVSGVYILVSKFAWSMNRFVLLASGYFKTSLKKLLFYSIPAAFIWSATFISLGYIFAEKSALLKKDLKIFTILVAIFFIMIIIIENIFQNLLKKENKILEEPKNNL